jgi:hypothetical protein
VLPKGSNPLTCTFAMARLGHASIKTTLDVYGHLMPGLGAQLYDALEKARNEAWNKLRRPGDGLAILESVQPMTKRASDLGV